MTHMADVLDVAHFGYDKHVPDRTVSQFPTGESSVVIEGGHLNGGFAFLVEVSPIVLLNCPGAESEIFPPPKARRLANAKALLPYRTLKRQSSLMIHIKYKFLSDFRVPFIHFAKYLVPSIVQYSFTLRIPIF
jgi:hypothetical protein